VGDKTNTIKTIH